MTEWHVELEVAGTLNDQQMEDAAGGVLMAHFNSSTSRGDLHLTVDAEDLATATRKALTIIARLPVQRLVTAGVLVAEAIRVQSERAHARTLSLLGAKEVAARLGVSTARLRQLRANHPAFPQPVTEVAGGQLYEAADIDAFDRDWDRRPGRPRRAAGSA